MTNTMPERTNRHLQTGYGPFSHSLEVLNIGFQSRMEKLLMMVTFG